MSNSIFEPFNEYLERNREVFFRNIPDFREANRIRSLILDEYPEILGQSAIVLCGEVIDYKNDKVIRRHCNTNRNPDSGNRPHTGINVIGVVGDVTTIGRSDWLAKRGTTVTYHEPCLTVLDDSPELGIRRNIPLVTLSHLKSPE